MKQIFSLEKELEEDQSIVELTQKLTLDKSRPSMGLQGKYGLYGSTKWWESLYKGKIPQVIYEGTIENVHFSGMNNESKSFSLNLTNGGTYTYTCVANNKKDKQLYKSGVNVIVTTFIEKMKNGTEQDFVWKIEIENA